jgi:hypothetical protein
MSPKITQRIILKVKQFIKNYVRFCEAALCNLCRYLRKMQASPDGTAKVGEKAVDFIPHIKHFLFISQANLFIKF